ncbi:MAG TPA: LacI family DNA-binding transcriptional regulator [Cyclobacteriaceae bacterium]
MSVTIRKIAKDLKIAVSTVSKALSDSHEISEETKRKVFEYARKLDYVPNAYAGSLKNRKTKNIAVVLPEVADTFFSNAINGIDSIAHTKGYHVLVYLTHESSEREESILQELRGGRVDGVLISVSGGIKKDSQIHAQVAKELPLIFFDRVCDEISTAKVLTDDLESSYNATNHLIAKGCREIVFFSAAGNLSIINQREEGFMKSLRENGMESSTQQQIIKCSEDENETYEIIKNVLRGEKKVDGVVCSVEKLAMQVYRACYECKLSIPKQVKVIAFSNLQIASLLAPSLSTVMQPAFAMGEAAATLLFKSLAKKIDLKQERVVLPSILYERESTGKK